MPNSRDQIRKLMRNGPTTPGATPENAGYEFSVRVKLMDNGWVSIKNHGFPGNGTNLIRIFAQMIEEAELEIGKRARGQYKTHRAGSAKGKVHRTFDEQGREAAIKHAVRLGKGKSTAQTWASDWTND